MSVVFVPFLAVDLHLHFHSHFYSHFIVWGGGKDLIEEGNNGK